MEIALIGWFRAKRPEIHSMNDFIKMGRLPSGIPGFDYISDGGFPKGRSTLVSGTSGSAKTVFASQFLAAGIRNYNEPGVFITFEESPEEIRRNMAGFGWDIEQWESDRLWAFVDASPDPERQPTVAGDFDFEALLARIRHAITRTRAQRLAMDSLGSIFSQFSDSAIVRRELFRIAASLKSLGVTSLLTAERTREYGDIARFSVEEFAVENVIVLRNPLEEQRRRRTIEILKFRGTGHRKGEYPFSLKSGEGVIVIPLSAIELKQRSSDVRITSGNLGLDQMCGGGFFRDSILLASGPTGTGKTLMATEFMAGGVAQGERCLFFAFEESREQLYRNAKSWGMDLPSMESKGLLQVISAYPESESLEDHLISIKQAIADFQPHRVAVDSLSALERIATFRSFREFVIGLTSHIKHQEIAGFFTATTSLLLGGDTITDQHISTITDSIILLRYVEMYGEIRRGIAVLKMRGSPHDKNIREFMVDNSGLKIGQPFREITGLLAGAPRQASGAEKESIRQFFTKE